MKPIYIEPVSALGDRERKRLDDRDGIIGTKEIVYDDSLDNGILMIRVG